MPTYRRKKNRDTWHWCRNCSNWPKSNYVERSTKPTSGELIISVKQRKKEEIVENSKLNRIYEL